MNCFREELCSTTNGNVYVSNCRSYVRIEYNNIVMLQNWSVLASFLDHIDRCRQNINSGSVFSDKRSYSFTTQVAHLTLRFSNTEIRELHYLLQSALLKAKAYA